MFEYKVIPAPVKGLKAKGVKAPEARFALGVEAAINALAAEGWEYLRSDVLPSEERQGLAGSVTHWRTLLVFRRRADRASQVDHATAGASGTIGPAPAPEVGKPAARVEAEPQGPPPVTSAAPEGEGVAEAETEATAPEPATVGQETPDDHVHDDGSDGADDDRADREPPSERGVDTARRT